MGMQDILVVAVDNLSGFSEAIATVFPRADVQTCIVHQIRSALKYAARKHCGALTAAMRPIHQASTEAAGTAALGDFAADWRDRYHGGVVVAGQLARTGDLLTCYRHPEGLRHPISTTNLTEGFHRPERQGTKSKSLNDGHGADENAVPGGPRA